MIAGCAADQTRPAVVDKNGVRHISGRWNAAPQDEFKSSQGTVVFVGNPNQWRTASIKYEDGTVASLYFGTLMATPEAQREFQEACGNVSRCPQVGYQDHSYAIAPLDGRDWPDSELWMLIKIRTYKDTIDSGVYNDTIQYQACRNGEYYGAPDLKALMDTMDKVDAHPAAVHGDPDVAKYLIVDAALIRRLPVCTWRHRVGFDAVYPAPLGAMNVRVVPASHSRMEYVEVKGDKGNGIAVYVDQSNQRLDRFVFKSPQSSSTLRPVYNETDCPTFNRCEHFVVGPDQKPNRFDIRSLDDEPLIQSRVFEVNDTFTHINYYDGCAGGRLYTGKNRDQVEREVKEALENPAPPPVKGAPVLGAPETTESGDTVIPDAFCDWTYRRKQAQALMKSQGAQ
jgi:hypothetical protein